MLNKKALFIFISIVCCCQTAKANIFNFAREDLKPYMGIDFHFLDQKFDTDFGYRILKHDYGQGNFFIGTTLNEYFSFEAGFETTSKRTRETVLPVGAVYLGSMPIPNPMSLTSMARFRNYNFNVLGFMPISKLKDFSLIGSFGITRMRAEIRSVTTHVNGVIVPEVVIDLKGSKWILRIGGGAKYQLGEHIYLRGLLTWKQASSLLVEGKRSLGSSAFVKLKDSLSYGFGLVFVS